ncbi:MAG: hypothetical protein ABR540_06845 [Acidimicrobiales bacterium]|nr:hypothetical protein [Actinomycetota bacterium]
MDGLEFRMLQRRVDFLESIIEQSGILENLDPIGLASDPAPDDIVRARPSRAALAAAKIKVPRPGDPSPVDIGRLSKVQLQATLHQLAAERVRLESMEALVKEQLEGGPG